MTETPKLSGLEALVVALPEIYQPIFGHPEFSVAVSRPCADRVELISEVVDKLRSLLGREVRVLDLGCAQGFVSLSLAARGATVHGIDYLDQNIDVCLALQAEFDGLRATFASGRLEDAVAEIQTDQYDVVLGLSVFHHLVHGAGFEAIRQLLADLAQKVGIGIHELALDSEPVYWADSLPSDPRALISDHAFVRLIGNFPTHLSDVVRPMFLASNRYWYAGGELVQFDSVNVEPHALAQGVHAGTRRYFQSRDFLLKQFTKTRPDGLQVNVTELQGEHQFLSEHADLPWVPSLVSFESSGDEMYLQREKIPGVLLSELMAKGEMPDRDRLLDNVLEQVVMLEDRGLYHNDLRPWNVLIGPDQRVTLIDFGAIGPDPHDCAWPFDVYLSFLTFIREVQDGAIAKPSPIRPAWLSPANLNEPYRTAIVSFLCQSRSSWSFRSLSSFIAKSRQSAQPTGRDPEVISLELLALLEEVSTTCNGEIQARELRAQDALNRAQLSQAEAERVATLALKDRRRAEQANALAEQANARAEEARRERGLLAQRVEELEAARALALSKVDRFEASAAAHRHRAEQAQATNDYLLDRLKHVSDEMISWKRTPFKRAVSFYWQKIKPN